MNTLTLKAASRYATSLLQQASETGVLENVYKDVLLFKKVGEENSNLLKTLQSPIIKNEKKLAILTALFKSRIDKLTFNLFRVVSHRKREAILSAIMSAFLEQYYAYKETQVASITTTFKLSDDLINYFKNLVKSLTPCKEVILTECVDPSIQGGFILCVADKQLDNSLVTRLCELKKQFSIAEY